MAKLSSEAILRSRRAWLSDRQAKLENFFSTGLGFMDQAVLYCRALVRKHNLKTDHWSR